MKALLIIAAITASAVLSSCNTFIGMGRDFKQLGDGMEGTANKVHNGNSGADTSGAPVY